MHTSQHTLLAALHAHLTIELLHTFAPHTASIPHCMSSQVWNEDDPDDVVLTMVARTGVNSTIGNMLRKALRPANYLSSSDSLVQVCLRALFLPFCCDHQVASRYHCNTSDAHHRLVPPLVCLFTSLLVQAGVIRTHVVQHACTRQILSDFQQPFVPPANYPCPLSAAQHCMLCMCVLETCQTSCWVFP